MNKLSRKVVKHGTRGMLVVATWLARRPRLHGVTRGYLRALAAGMARLRHIGPKEAPGAIGAEWQRGFGSAKEVPISSVDDRTVYAEIRTVCPLRGSGDVEACYRTMEYDRAILERIGGSFVVLQSQAEPGVTVCKVAMRRAGVSVDDLVPAHLRVNRQGPTK